MVALEHCFQSLCSFVKKAPGTGSSATLKPKASGVAKAFKDDSDSDEEEMPPEAKMRMKNLGKLVLL